jgi:tryptophan halogenase
MNNIVIVGGGTAGWLSALFVQKNFDNPKTITLIESEEIGILGAGEGSVGLLPIFLQSLDIDVYEFLSAVNGTPKLGVNFENWNGDGDSYLHHFKHQSEFDISKTIKEYYGYLYENKLDIQTHEITSVVANSGKTHPKLSTSFHFDAHLVAKYLRKIAETKGIIRIEGIVKSFAQKSNGDISEIRLENGQVVKSDFVFDCSGFKRLIIGELFKSKWKDYSDILPVNSAIPFFLPQSDIEIKPHTRAIAMKYGWMWMIPLQNRWGCGYVFDDTYINSDEAKKEVEDFLGHNIDVNRTIKFKAGRYEDFCVNNCIAIGLSSGFTEPLEATAIMVIMFGLYAVMNVNKKYKSFDDFRFKKEYNSYMSAVCDDTADFLQFHYFTKRNDTEFWKKVTNNPIKSKHLVENIESFSKGNGFVSTTHTNVFVESSYMLVGNGIEYFDKNFFMEYYKKYANKEIIENIHKRNLENIKTVIKESTDLVSSLKILKNKYQKF